MTIGAVILAAGGSTRMGRPKALLELAGETLVQRAVRTARDAGLDPVCVVAGAEMKSVAAAVRSSGAVLVDNSQWKEGVGTSIAAGVTAVLEKQEVSALIIMLVDQPLLTAAVLRNLISRRDGCQAVATLHEGSPGVPALFDRSLFGALQSLGPSSGAQSLLRSLGTAVELVDIGSANVDVDTPEQFAVLADSLDHATAEVQVRARDQGIVRTRSDRVAMEEPLEIRVRGRAVSVTMRTPGHDDELAAGFLFTEGVVPSREAIEAIEPCARSEHGNAVNVRLAPWVAIDFEQLARNVFAASSCGICGKASIESVRRRLPAIGRDAAATAETLLSLPASLASEQRGFDETGGLHAAAVFDCRGERLCLREDIGRHNAVDKVLGWALLNSRTPLDDHILLISGRASFEIMQKAAAAGVQIVAAVSAPSSLAVEFASTVGQTLVAFLRPPRFNIYSHAERILA